MNQQSRTILGVIAFAVIIMGAIFAYNVLVNDEANAPDSMIIHTTVPTQTTAPTMQESTTAPQTQPETGLEPAPNFNLLDSDGNELQLSDFFGKPIVLNFWATWCPACVRETPVFETLYQEYGDRVHVLKVNLLGSRGETKEIVENFMHNGGYTFPLFFDDNDSGARAYAVRGIPITFFIDENGYIAATASGSLNERTMAQGLETILR